MIIIWEPCNCFEFEKFPTPKFTMSSDEGVHLSFIYYPQLCCPCWVSPCLTQCLEQLVELGLGTTLWPMLGLLPLHMVARPLLMVLDTVQDQTRYSNISCHNPNQPSPP